MKEGPTLLLANRPPKSRSQAAHGQADYGQRGRLLANRWLQGRRQKHRPAGTRARAMTFFCALVGWCTTVGGALSCSSSADRPQLVVTVEKGACSCSQITGGEVFLLLSQVAGDCLLDHRQWNGSEQPSFSALPLEKGDTLTVAVGLACADSQGAGLPAGERCLSCSDHGTLKVGQQKEIRLTPSKGSSAMTPCRPVDVDAARNTPPCSTGPTLDAGLDQAPLDPRLSQDQDAPDQHLPAVDQKIPEWELAPDAVGGEFRDSVWTFFLAYPDRLWKLAWDPTSGERSTLEESWTWPEAGWDGGLEDFPGFSAAKGIDAMAVLPYGENDWSFFITQGTGMWGFAWTPMDIFQPFKDVTYIPFGDWFDSFWPVDLGTHDAGATPGDAGLPGTPPDPGDPLAGLALTHQGIDPDLSVWMLTQGGQRWTYGRDRLPESGSPAFFDQDQKSQLSWFNLVQIDQWLDGNQPLGDLVISQDRTDPSLFHLCLFQHHTVVCYDWHENGSVSGQVTFAVDDVLPWSF